MPTATTNYALQKPLVNNATDQDLWGDELNDDLDDIDTLLRQGITIETQATQTSVFAAIATISVKYLYPCDNTGGSFGATIPAAATAGNGATVFIKKIDASAFTTTLTRTSSDTLDGATSLVISNQNDCYGLVSDGVSAWSSICRPANVVDATTSVKGIAQLATAAEVLAGASTTKVATPDALAGNKSLAASGYYKFPGGLIMQWGTGSISNGSTVTFPTAFASACYNVVIGHADTASDSLGAQTLTTTNFAAVKGAGGSSSVYWQAVGV